MSLSFLKSRNWLFLWRAHKDKLWPILAAVMIVMAMRVEPKEEIVFMPPKITAPDEEKIMLHLDAMDRIAEEMRMRQPVDKPKGGRK